LSRKTFVGNSSPKNASALEASRSEAVAIDELNIGLLDGLLGYHLRRAQNAAFQGFADRLRHRQITPGQLGLLVLIANNPGVSQTDLARAVGIERSTLGEFINRFESRGLVERRTAALDRRRYAIHLSTTGQRFLSELLPEVTEHERELAKPLSEDERDTLIVLLKRVSGRD